jgi:DNA repair exonuclease SbcCD ATPase subunit
MRKIIILMFMTISLPIMAQDVDTLEKQLKEVESKIQALNAERDAIREKIAKLKGVKVEDERTPKMIKIDNDIKQLESDIRAIYKESRAKKDEIYSGLKQAKKEYQAYLKGDYKDKMEEIKDYEKQRIKEIKEIEDDKEKNREAKQRMYDLKALARTVKKMKKKPEEKKAELEKPTKISFYTAKWKPLDAEYKKRISDKRQEIKALREERKK